MKKICVIIFAVATIACMTAIFIFSSQNSMDTTELSNSVSEKIASIIFPDYNILDYSSKQILTYEFNFFLRKVAHFTMYFLTGFSLFALCSCVLKRYLISGLLSILICFVYSLTDEFHQSLVPGRTPLIKDIIIDTSGAFFGTIFCFMVIATMNMLLRIIKKDHGNA